MIDTRTCPTCAGTGVIELSHGHDPYTGERVSLDNCPDCGGVGEIEVEPIEEEDLPP